MKEFFEIHRSDNILKMIANDGKNVHEQAEELFSSLKSYFNTTQEEMTKCSVHFNYIHQIPEIMSSCLTAGSSFIEDWSEQERKHKNLKTAEVCLNIILIYFECPQTEETLKSVIQTSTSVLHLAYSHCKVSEAFYGELFEEFTNELGSFYKNIQDVQKATVKSLENLLKDESFHEENDRAEIISISRGIGQLSELITTLDQNIALIFWKIFSKLISKYKDIVREEIEAGVFLLPLILNIEEIVSQVIYNIKSKEPIAESDIKLCIIELSLMKKIVQVFNGCFKKNFILNLRSLSLQLFSLLVMSNSYDVPDSKDLSVIKILLKTVKHAILPLFSDSLFFTSTLHTTQKDISPELQVPLIMLKLTAIDCLKSYPGHFQLLESEEVFLKVFSTLKQNKPEDDLKLVNIKIPTCLLKEINKEILEPVSLYQHCYLSLAEYSKLFLGCSDVSTLLNKKLLDILISSSDVVALLISDVWMYYLRCGSIENVLKCCYSLAEISTESSNSRIVQLLTRMLRLLPDDLKIQLFKEKESLDCLLSPYKAAYRFEKMQPDDFTLQSSYKEIIAIAKDLTDPSKNDFKNGIQKICAVFEFCSAHSNNLSSDQLLKFIEFASLLLKSDIYEIQSSIVTFLKYFTGRNLSKNDNKFDLFTTALAQLLSDLMQSKNYLIKLEAFHLYFRLAESTPHPEIVKKTVIKCPSLVPSIKSYAEKIPVSGFLKDDEKFSLNKKQLTNYQSNDAFQITYSEKSKQLLTAFFS